MTSRALATTPTAGGRSSALSLFDQRPIELPGYRLRAFKAEPIGKPTLDQCINALTFAEAAEESSPYWVGDILLQIDSRPDFKEMRSQAIGQLRMPRQTQYNLKSISKRLTPAARAVAPSRKHAESVLTLPEPEQVEWLQAARDGEWTERELKHAIKQKARSQDITGRAETMHTIDVTVQVEMEAAAPFQAEDAAWGAVKAKLGGERHMKVIAAHARPQRED